MISRRGLGDNPIMPEEITYCRRVETPLWESWASGPILQVPSLQDLFKAVKPEVILEFLKAAALYRLL